MLITPEDLERKSQLLTVDEALMLRVAVRLQELAKLADRKRLSRLGYGEMKALNDVTTWWDEIKSGGKPNA
jgi:hypothetical protein